jgi:4-amino-4-deoxy-L-arabinose transferase-like glycosyltransferase
MSLAVVSSPQALRPTISQENLSRWLDHSCAPLVVLLPYCAFLFFYGLTAGDLYRTEALRAIIAQQFLNSGNWIVPTLYGEPLLTKPPGMYAAIALVSIPFGGVTTWSARLPSALAATLTTLLFFWAFRRSLGQRAALLASLMLPASLLWLDKATSAEIDMVQLAWVVGAVLFFLRALEIEESTDNSGSFKWWLLSLLCVAGGVLTKWTAPAFFYLTAIPLLWWRGRLRLLFGRKHLIAATLGALLCFGWAALAIAHVGWHTFYETVSREACQRLVPNEVPFDAPRHHHRPYPWTEVLAHPFVIGGCSLPWSLSALVTLWPGFARLWDERGRRLLQLLHCWTWPSLLFWSIVPEHAARHSIPLYPGLAGLGAMVWIAWLTGRLRWPIPRLGPAKVLAGFLIAWFVVKIIFIHGVIPSRNKNREPGIRGAQIAAVVPEDQPLYLFHLKDEGIMFYYSRCHTAGSPDRVVQRLTTPNDLPSTVGLVYCVVTDSEWSTWDHEHLPVTVILESTDQQGEKIRLLRVEKEHVCTPHFFSHSEAFVWSKL